ASSARGGVSSADIRRSTFASNGCCYYPISLGGPPRGKTLNTIRIVTPLSGRPGTLLEPPKADYRASSLEARVRATLELVNKWGYVPTLQVLAGSLLGGGEKVEFVEATVRNLGDVSIQHGLACLDGSEELVEPSLRRLRSNQSLNGAAQQIAHEFAE